MEKRVENKSASLRCLAFEVFGVDLIGKPVANFDHGTAFDTIPKTSLDIFDIDRVRLPLSNQTPLIGDIINFHYL